MEKASLLPFLGGMIATFLLTVVFLRILIPKLKSLKVGQKILEIGPRWPKSKEGTPTMGGLAFICAGAPVLEPGHNAAHSLFPG